MRTRTLGSTGLTVTPIGLGLAAVGRPAYINLTRQLGDSRDVESLRGRAHRVLDAAESLGIGYIDVARSYGKAEEFLASWLDQRASSARSISVGSKWGYRYVGDWQLDAPVHEVKDHSLAALQNQYETSRTLLGDHLDLYQIHSATPDTGVLDDVSVLAKLVELADAGMRIGLSVSGPTQAGTIHQALEAAVDGINPFSCVQATWNVLETSATSALQAAHEAGWGVIIKEGLANGRLALASHAPAVVNRLTEVYEVAPDTLALAAVLSQPWVDVVLSGATSQSQLASNVAAVRVSLQPEHLDELTELSEPSSEYWATRGDLVWH